MSGETTTCNLCKGTILVSEKITHLKQCPFFDTANASDDDVVVKRPKPKPKAASSGISYMSGAFGANDEDDSSYDRGGGGGSGGGGAGGGTSGGFGGFGGGDDDDDYYDSGPRQKITIYKRQQDTEPASSGYRANDYPVRGRRSRAAYLHDIKVRWQQLNMPGVTIKEVNTGLKDVDPDSIPQRNYCPYCKFIFDSQDFGAHVQQCAQEHRAAEDVEWTNVMNTDPSRYSAPNMARLKQKGLLESQLEQDCFEPPVPTTKSVWPQRQDMLYPTNPHNVPKPSTPPRSRSQDDGSSPTQRGDSAGSARAASPNRGQQAGVSSYDPTPVQAILPVLEAVAGFVDKVRYQPSQREAEVQTEAGRLGSARLTSFSPTRQYSHGAQSSAHQAVGADGPDPALYAFHTSMKSAGPNPVLEAWREKRITRQGERKAQDAQRAVSRDKQRIRHHVTGGNMNVYVEPAPFSRQYPRPSRTADDFPGDPYTSMTQQGIPDDADYLETETHGPFPAKPVAHQANGNRRHPAGNHEARPPHSETGTTGSRSPASFPVPSPAYPPHPLSPRKPSPHARHRAAADSGNIVPAPYGGWTYGDPSPPRGKPKTRTKPQAWEEHRWTDQSLSQVMPPMKLPERPVSAEERPPYTKPDRGKRQTYSDNADSYIQELSPPPAAQQGSWWGKYLPAWMTGRTAAPPPSAPAPRTMPEPYATPQSYDIPGRNYDEGNDSEEEYGTISYDEYRPALDVREQEREQMRAAAEEDQYQAARIREMRELQSSEADAFEEAATFDAVDGMLDSKYPPYHQDAIIEPYSPEEYSPRRPYQNEDFASSDGYSEEMEYAPEAARNRGHGTTNPPMLPQSYEDLPLPTSTSNRYDKGGRHDPRRGAQALQPEAFKDGPDDRVPCPVCGRMFAPDRVSKHAKICLNNAKKQAAKPNPAKQEPSTSQYGHHPGQRVVPHDRQNLQPPTNSYDYPPTASVSIGGYAPIPPGPQYGYAAAPQYPYPNGPQYMYPDDLQPPYANVPQYSPATAPQYSSYSGGPAYSYATGTEPRGLYPYDTASYVIGSDPSTYAPVPMQPAPSSVPVQPVNPPMTAKYFPSYQTPLTRAAAYARAPPYSEASDSVSAFRNDFPSTNRPVYPAYSFA